MPAGMYGMLPPEGICVPDAGRSRPDGGLHRYDRRGVREAVRLPQAAADETARSKRRRLPVSGGGPLLDSSRQADAVPHLPVLAGTGGEPARMEEDGALLP